jgi:hypothetical protein
VKIGERTRESIVGLIEGLLEDNESGIDEAFRKQGSELSLAIAVKLKGDNPSVAIRAQLSFVKEKVTASDDDVVNEEQGELFPKTERQQQQGINPPPSIVAIEHTYPDSWGSGLEWLMGWDKDADSPVKGRVFELVEYELDDEDEYPDPDETYSDHFRIHHFRDGLEWLIGKPAASQDQEPSRVNAYGVLVDTETISVSFSEKGKVKAGANVEVALGPDGKWYFGEKVSYGPLGGGCAPSMNRPWRPGRDSRVEVILEGLAVVKDWFARNGLPKNPMKYIDDEIAKWQATCASLQN